MATSGQTDALGVVHFSYKSAPGLETNLPPAGLRASAATPKLLADLGMRKSSSSAAQQAALLSAHRVAPTFCRSAAQPNAAKFMKTSAPTTTRSGIRFSHFFSPNWAGYEIDQASPSSPGVNSVSGTFTVGNDRTLTGPGAESTWVGIGGGLPDFGAASWGLIQDGISMISGRGYQSWFEFLGTSQTCETTVACDAQYATAPAGVARPGDTVTAQVDWQDSTTPDACFVLTDVQHPAANISSCMAVPIPYDQTSGEWINENLGQGIVFDNPGTINFTKQLYSSSFSAAGTGSSPFPGAEAVLMYGTFFPSGATSCGSNGGLLSYPTGAKTVSSGGQSSIITCSVNLFDAP